MSDFLSITKCLPIQTHRRTATRLRSHYLIERYSDWGGKRFPCELFFQSILDFMAIDQQRMQRKRGREWRTKKEMRRTCIEKMYIPRWRQQYNANIAPKEWIKTSRSQTKALSLFKIACSWTFFFLLHSFSLPMSCLLGHCGVSTCVGDVFAVLYLCDILSHREKVIYYTWNVYSATNCFRR